LHTRMVGEATAMGIDLDSPMTAKAPRSAPKGGPQVTGAAPGSNASTGSGSDRVSVTGPDGALGTIPRKQLQKALKRGYKLSSTAAAGGVN
jgi:hypothetical protein